MGATIAWRGENEREPARYGKTISFGNLRDRGTGYMSYSDRVGPGLVVLGGSTALCDRLTREGFTALAPDLGGDEDKAARLIDAAIDHLLDNWHPRVGIVAVGARGGLGEAAASRRSVDAVAFVGTEADVDDDLLDDFRYDLS